MRCGSDRWRDDVRYPKFGCCAGVKYPRQGPSKKCCVDGRVVHCTPPDPPTGADLFIHFLNCHDAPADPWWLNRGSEAAFCVAGAAGCVAGLAAAIPELGPPLVAVTCASDQIAAAQAELAALRIALSIYE